MDVATTPSNRNKAPLYVEKTDPRERQQRHLQHDDIEGWGADSDPKMRPGYPMERTPPRLENIPDPGQQRTDVKIYHSAERPGLTPVFGTTCPPSVRTPAMIPP